MSEQIEPHIQKLNECESELWRQLGNLNVAANCGPIPDQYDRRNRLRAAIDLISEVIDTLHPEWSCGCDRCQERLDKILEDRFNYRDPLSPEAKAEEAAKNAKQLYRFALTHGDLQVIFGVRADSPEEAVELANQGLETEHWGVDVEMGGPFDYFETQIYSCPITIEQMLPWDRRQPGEWWIWDEGGIVSYGPYPSREAAMVDYPGTCDQNPSCAWYVMDTEEAEKVGKMTVLEEREYIHNRGNE
jgi:hypothetical protein